MRQTFGSLMHVVSTSAQRHFYRNGQIREEVPLRDGHRHGAARTWHRNGMLASEEPYQNGFLHGVCRQWDETGRLLGEYEMVHGTGMQRAWYDNGQLNLETPTIKGEFCGRSRVWLRDGTLISEKFYLQGRTVTAAKYRAAATRDRTLPRFRGSARTRMPAGRARQQRIHQVFVDGILSKRNRCEARQWFRRDIKAHVRHSLGRFKSEDAAMRFVEALYKAGAEEVIVADIYAAKTGDQFSDNLLVRLPQKAVYRATVRKVCKKLCREKLGAIEPEKEIGETFLFLSMS